MRLLGQGKLPWFGLLAMASLGCLVGVGSYTFKYAEGASYLGNDSRTCANCHIMREHYDSWQKSSHHAVTGCNDCHLPQDFVSKYLAKAENGFCHSKGFTFQDFHEPIRIRPGNAKILQDNCVRCHQDIVAELVHHGSFGDGSHRCVDCHAAVGHGASR